MEAVVFSWENSFPADSKCPFYSLVGGHDYPLKGSLHHPKKVTKIYVPGSCLFLNSRDSCVRMLVIVTFGIKALIKIDYSQSMTILLGSRVPFSPKRKRQIWRAYFSDGLKPPTRRCPIFCVSKKQVWRSSSSVNVLLQDSRLQQQKTRQW